MSETHGPALTPHDAEVLEAVRRTGPASRDLVVAPGGPAAASSSRLVLILGAVAALVVGAAGYSALAGGSQAKTATREQAPSPTTASSAATPAGSNTRASVPLQDVMIPSITGFARAPKGGLASDGPLTPEQYVDSGGLRGADRAAALAVLRSSEIYARTWVRQGSAVVEMALRLPTDADAQGFVDGASNRLGGRTAVAGIRGAMEGSTASPAPGLDARALVFRKGRLAFYFLSLAGPGELKRDALGALAREQFARAPLDSRSGAPVRATSEDTNAYRAGYAGAKVVGLIVLLLVATAVLLGVRKRRRRHDTVVPYDQPAVPAEHTATCANGHGMAVHHKFCATCGAAAAA